MAYLPDLVNGPPVMGPNSEFTLTAGEDLSALQYHLVTVGADWLVYEHDPATEPVLMGVLQNAPLEGEMACVRIFGFSYYVLADAVIRGEYIMWDAAISKFEEGASGHTHDGEGKPPEAGTFATIIGQACQSGGASDTVLIRLMFQVI